ncbi:hypothetical protein [Haloactinopolyspora alba]|uniref:hypothetical protein n=1 Tax=Haloactinopolyspora alba TaxID=648780 RepID=UPI00101C66B0|nr:hypothetical protein [Haloactinopolyspora alba]
MDLLTDTIADGSYDGVNQADENTEPTWAELADREIAAMARSGSEFTSSDLREVIGEPEHPNHWGPRFTAARRAGVIELVAVRPSSTPSRHGGLVRVWRGVT